MVLIDDDDSLRRALARAIRLADFDVTTFESAEAMLAEGLPAEGTCLVIDVGLPGTDGIALKRRIEEAGGDFPTIFITALSPAELGNRFTTLGHTTVLHKPFNKELLITAIEFACG